MRPFVHVSDNTCVMVCRGGLGESICTRARAASCLSRWVGNAKAGVLEVSKNTDSAPFHIDSKLITIFQRAESEGSIG